MFLTLTDPVEFTEHLNGDSPASQSRTVDETKLAPRLGVSFNRIFFVCGVFSGPDVKSGDALGPDFNELGTVVVTPVMTVVVEEPGVLAVTVVAGETGVVDPIVVDGIPAALHALMMTSSSTNSADNPYCGL
jgi:hypothetical protein